MHISTHLRQIYVALTVYTKTYLLQHFTLKKNLEKTETFQISMISFQDMIFLSLNLLQYLGVYCRNEIDLSLHKQTKTLLCHFKRKYT